MWRNSFPVDCNPFQKLETEFSIEKRFARSRYTSKNFCNPDDSSVTNRSSQYSFCCGCWRPQLLIWCHCSCHTFLCAQASVVSIHHSVFFFAKIKAQCSFFASSVSPSHEAFDFAAELSQAVVDAGAVPLLVLCIQEPELSLKRISASALSDVCKHSPELAQTVVDAGAIAHLAQMILNPDAKLKVSSCRRFVWLAALHCHTSRFKYVLLGFYSVCVYHRVC